MAESSYSKKLRDPRWQKKRLEVLERDEWHCQLCCDSESTLHVHHKWYSGEPWDAPLGALFTICEYCHEEDHSARPAAEARLIRAMKSCGLSPALIDCISEGLEALAARDALYPGPAGVPLMRLGFIAGGIKDVLSDEQMCLDFGEEHIQRNVAAARARRAVS